MRVKTIKAYYDLTLKKDIDVGHEHTVEDERGKELITANVAEEILQEPKRENKEPTKENTEEETSAQSEKETKKNK